MFWQEENRGRNKNDEIYRSANVSKIIKATEEIRNRFSSWRPSYHRISVPLTWPLWLCRRNSFGSFSSSTRESRPVGLLRRSPATMEKPVRWFNCKECATNMLDAIYRIDETRFCSTFCECDETRRNAPRTFKTLRNLIYYKHQPTLLSIIITFDKILNKNLRLGRTSDIKFFKNVSPYRT